MKVEGEAGYRLATKLKLLKLKIKEWAKNNFGEVGERKAHLLEEIQRLDRKEEDGLLALEEEVTRTNLKEEFQRKVREEEILWGQRSRFKWLKDRD